mgnify:CR=1 FL=1|tara:strand:+ start:6524 stop:6985 length:462 start_codon:yes stop_codon:yes gene_type:complete
MFIFKLIREIRLWRKVKKVLEENTDSLNESGFRVDWVGRAYTVINLPEEVANHNETVQEGYVLQKLRDYDELFLKLGVSDVLIPEMERIDEPGAAAFLLILAPARRYLNLGRILLSLLSAVLGIFAIRVIFKLISKYNVPIAEFFNNAKEIIF